MRDLRDLIVRWQRGWGVARALPAAEDVDGGLRLRCMQPGRDVEYIATDAGADRASLTKLAELVAGEDSVTWLTVPTTDPAGTASALTAAGLVLLKRSELLMTADLDGHPQSTPAAPYRLLTQIDAHRGGRVVTATVRHEDGEVSAHGSMGLAGPDAVADRIETVSAHRRNGLASAVMSALTRSARDEGAEHGILIASEEGQRLYTTLGWQPVADVLIATTPGNRYPS
ncbi:GNAT family N-acetyltransferase [Actinoplanes sp. NEAU-A12]|uniref:GNAT family N-acetyltransferase n=1 Tax=Actinoplanes sandaracinus TaxID=3045177 RepID=A0ABT6WJN7_9ACTN|nr:GNAT family N-acetyltransferase [Actinoplanes sandaracinus]MDI6099937.1 GNAT family N-acetyltransferase [Actinoplanes sandaracinus]